MFREIRKKKNEISLDMAKHLLESERRGVLSVIGDDGYPYGVPVNYVYSEAEAKIYFHGSKAGHKVDSIRKCDKVCFTVIDQDTVVPERYATDYICVTVFGRAAFIEESERKYTVLDKLGEKYRPGYEDERRQEIEGAIERTGIIEIAPEHITGKESLALSNKRSSECVQIF